MDFKTQIIKDMAVFHNPAEFATKTTIWYEGKRYSIPLILDHEAAEERKRLNGDHGEGLNSIQALAYIALVDLGFVPHRGSNIEIDVAGAVEIYKINKADLEDGEIILELGAFDE